MVAHDNLKNEAARAAYARMVHLGWEMAKDGDVPGESLHGFVAQAIRGVQGVSAAEAGDQVDEASPENTRVRFAFNQAKKRIDIHVRSDRSAHGVIQYTYIIDQYGSDPAVRGGVRELPAGGVPVRQNVPFDLAHTSALITVNPDDIAPPLAANEHITAVRWSMILTDDPVPGLAAPHFEIINERITRVY
jgi:hypothetical protein